MVHKKVFPPTSWVQYRRPQPEARMRLFCFPYAGGGATIFHPFVDLLPAEIEVCPIQLPGRESRLNERAFSHMESLIHSLAEALLPYLDMPYAFFGHSMGALISFELARELRRREHLPELLQLVVSGHRAPHLPDFQPPIYQLPTNQFIGELRRFNGTSEEVLQHDELLRMLLPLLRADFELCETYSYISEPPLACPITAFGGLRDSAVPRESMRAWREHTNGPFQINFFPGDHFFIRHEQASVCRFLAQRLLSPKAG